MMKEMAAPIVDKSRENSTLNKLLSKEKSTKLTQKHVLCAENYEWPRPSKQVEELILSQLSETLKSLPNIIQSKKAAENDSQLEANKREKARIRAQLQIGTSSVFRALERNELECVLVSGTATPAISVDHIISIGRDKGCPLLCLDGLSTTLAAASESKFLPLTIGFRHPNSDDKPEFTEIIRMVKEHAPCRDVNTANSCPTIKAQPSLPSLINEGSKLHKGGLRPVHLDDANGKEILFELKRVFSSALIGKTAPTKNKKKVKNKGRKNVKEPFEKHLHSQFEAGRRGVQDGLDRGRLQVVLASQEVEEVLASSPLVMPDNQAKRPPLFILPGLTHTLRELTSGTSGISFLGIKKLNLLPPDIKSDFGKILDLCEKSATNATIPNPKDEVGRNSEVGSLITDKNGATMTVPGSGGKNDVKEEHMEVGEKEEDEEEEDYSYLYILKKDSKDLSDLKSELRDDLEMAKKNASFSTDYISISFNSQATTSTSTGITKSSVQANKGKPRYKSQIALTSETLRNPISTGTVEKKSETKNAAGLVASTRGSSGFISLSSISEPEDASQNTRVSQTGVEQRQTKLTKGETPMEAGDSGHSLDKEKLAEATTRDNTDSGKLPEAGKSKATPNLKKEASCLPLFSLDRAGSGSKIPQEGPKSSSTADGPMASTRSPTQQSDSLLSHQGRALGEEHLQPQIGKQGMDFSVIDAHARSKKKSKALKRKLDKEDGFISFAYTEANIKTMVADPSKKRKKKKKK